MSFLDRFRSQGAAMQHRSELLNHLVATRGYQRYLEIGVRSPGENFDKVTAPIKHGVDPAPWGTVTYQMTSDDFFAHLAKTAPDTRYDLVFIDGLHLAEQVERDVINALAYLSPQGSVVLHDCNPRTRDAQTDDYDGVKHWNGTVWKAWAKLRATRPDLSMTVVDMDDGCGVITRGSQRCISLPALDYAALDFKYLKANRREVLNLVPPREFLAGS